ncbi:MAG TPA: DUF805 domain-containing protein [Hanamia sp.]
MFKNPFSFDGRIRRLEYGLSYLIYFIAILLLNLTMSNAQIESVFRLLIVIPLLWLLFAQGSKRCHDMGNSGWYQLIPLYVFWMVFVDGESGNNQYGPNPKGIGNTDEIDEIGSYLERNN